MEIRIPITYCLANHTNLDRGARRDLVLEAVGAAHAMLGHGCLGGIPKLVEAALTISITGKIEILI